MSQIVSPREPVRMTYTASQKTCHEDGAKLWICQHRVRTVHRLDETVEATFRDKGCPRDGCAASHLRFRPAEESMLASRRWIVRARCCTIHSLPPSCGQTSCAAV